MLKRTKVVSLLAADKPEQEVLVKGWVRTRRDAKDFFVLSSLMTAPVSKIFRLLPITI